MKAFLPTSSLSHSFDLLYNYSTNSILGRFDNLHYSTWNKSYHNGDQVTRGPCSPSSVFWATLLYANIFTCFWVSSPFHQNYSSVSTHSSHLSKRSVPQQLAEYVMINPSILHPYSQTRVNPYSRESFFFFFGFSFRGRSDSFLELLIILSCLQDLTSSFILLLTW